MASDIANLILGVRTDESTGADFPLGNIATRPRRRRPAPASPNAKTRKKTRDAVVARILGRADESEEGVIPGDAVEMDPGSVRADGLGLAEPEMPEEQPANPYKDTDEELMQPNAALVAPDVTPEATKPVDVAEVPPEQGPADLGNGGAPAAAPAAPAAAEEPVRPSPPGEAPTPMPSMRGEPSAMDTILGRTEDMAEQAERSKQILEATMASMQPQAPEPQGATPGARTAAQMAMTATGYNTVAAAETPGTPMPEHIEGDGRAVVSAFRKFAG